MTELSPSKAAELARDVYLAQTSREAILFLSKKDFCVNKANKNVIKAEVGTRLINTRDNFAVCALGGDSNKDEIFLLFRGTTTASYGADIFTDARFGIERSSAGLPVHIGFNHAFTSMLPEIKTFLSKHSNVTGTIHCIGHSLGGAVATLVSDWVVRNRANNVKLYTFGCPRVGTEWFADSHAKRILPVNINRVFHETDPVPMVPLYPFVHSSAPNTSYYLPSAQPLTSGQAHFMKNYVKSVKSKAWNQIRASGDEVYSIETSIEGWLKSKIPVDPSSSSFWQWANAALIYVLKKVSIGAAILIQGGLMGAVTLADKLAYILDKGIDIGASVSIWVYHLMRKLMQALGMKIVKDATELTRILIRSVLVRIIAKMTRNARNALKNI